MKTFKQLVEEIAMTAGGGHIAGIGVGPDGEPGVTKTQQERIKNQRDRMLSRFRKEAERHDNRKRRKD